MRNITRIVLSDTVLKPVKAVYLAILEENAKQEAKKDSTDGDDYVSVCQMLSMLRMLEIVGLFTKIGIKDRTLLLHWSQLRKLLEESGVKKGQLYEIKNYLLLMDRSTQSDTVNHNPLSVDPGVLLPQSAFVTLT